MRMISHSSADDATLVAAARRGDRAALEQLVRRCLPVVYSVLRQRFDAADADDVVQETFIRVVRHLDTLRDATRFRSWALSIAMQEARRHGRARQTMFDRASDGKIETMADRGDVEQQTIARLGLSQQRQEIAQATGWLDAEDRELLALWWLEISGELSRADLARTLDLTPEYAAVRVQRLRGRLDTARLIVRAVATLPTPYGCAGLRATLTTWDGARTPVWRKRLARHLADCDACSGARSGLVSADRLLATVPLLVASVGLLDQVMAGAGATAAAAHTGWFAKLAHAGKLAVTQPVAAVTSAAVVVAAGGAVAYAVQRPESRPAASVASPVAVAAAPVTTAPARAAAPPAPEPSAKPAATARPATAGAKLVPGPIALPRDLVPSIKKYGAKGDGRTDDTAAIQRALDDGRRGPDGASVHGADENYGGRPKALYFPAGTYRISRTLDWVGCCVTLMGAGSRATVFRLDDGAAGFGDPGRPAAVIRTPSGNQEFRHYLRDFRIDLGRGNPGAVGLDVIASNTGSVRNVDIAARDGRCVSGVDMLRDWPGPMMLADVRVTGCDHGIRAATGEYGVTLERITLEGQRKAGLRNANNTLSVRSLRSVNTVPAVVNAANDGGQTGDGIGSVALVDSSLVTPRGPVRGPAVQNGANLHVRNLRTQGYAAAIRSKGRTVTGPVVDEFLSADPQRLFDGKARSLRLPVKETPTFTSTPQRSAVFRMKEYGANPGLQQALNSGEPTVYVAWDIYFQWDELVVTVPAHVRRIVGFGAHVNMGEGRDGGGIRFVVEENGRHPLIVENVQHGITVDHRSKRAVALVDGGFRYTSRPGAGELFIEDMVLGPLTVQPGQKVWARQFNNEADPGAPKIVNRGTLWILGMKNEQYGTVLAGEPGSRAEILGNQVYPARGVPAGMADTPAYRLTDAALSVSGASFIGFGGQYRYLVEETRKGQTRRLELGRIDRYWRMPMFTTG